MEWRVNRGKSSYDPVFQEVTMGRTRSGGVSRGGG